MMADQLAAPPLPLRDGTITVAALIDLYVANAASCDRGTGYRLRWWKQQLGAITLLDLSDDQVGAALDRLAEGRSLYFAGRDDQGRAVMHEKRRTIAPATVNRYHSTLSGCMTWAVKRRITPKGWVHPCRGIERRPENNARTRYLSDAERERLLQACKGARWPRLYALVLLGLTTGARRGELLGLRWADLDLARGVAHVAKTKNGDPRTLPLTPAVIEELQRFKGAPAALIFGSSRDPARPFTFEKQFKEALRAAKVRDFTFHCLRHSFASTLAMRGRTLLEVADALGHRQLQMTKRYSHLATSHKAAMVLDVFGSVR